MAMARKHPILKGLGVLFVFILVTFAGVFFYAYLTGGDARVISMFSGEGIGVLQIEGTIDDSQSVLSELKRFKEAPWIKAIVVRIEEGVEGLVHVSQLSTERVDKPSSLYKVGDEIEAEVINLDPNERKIGLSVRALRKSEERQEMENYLKREKEGGRFSFEKLLNDELRLDRDESKTKE